MSDSLAVLSLQIHKEKAQNELLISKNQRLLNAIKTQSANVERLSKSVSAKHSAISGAEKRMRRLAASTQKAEARVSKSAKIVFVLCALTIIANASIRMM